jgi:metallo-beta-lactamase family protein
MPIRLTFHGAASTVTGSCYLVEHPGGRFLVDCGLFQGTKTIRELNYRPLPFSAVGLDFVLLTHAHIDHAGLLPKLVRAGFRGPVMATEPTADLLAFVLPDAADIQESEVARLNARNRRRGRPEVEPIYRRRDAAACLERLEPCDYGRWFEPGRGVRARLWNAAHILGSASIELEIEDGPGAPVRFLFSGDIGPNERELHDDPEGPSGLDHLLVESTYGGRDREDVTVEQRRRRLAREVGEALAAGGPLLIPSFAVERSQELLYTLLDLMERGELPGVPVFLDSPLAVKATQVFTRHRDALSEAGDLARLFATPRLRLCERPEDSAEIDRLPGPAIVLAASGMCEAGRIRRHLRNHLWRPEATVLFVGHQAAGTLGQVILSGEKRVRIGGEEVAVRARIRAIDAFSAHADHKELVAWVQARRPIAGGLFLTHGEEAAAAALRAELAAGGLDPLGIVVPQLDQCFELVRGAAPRRVAAPSRLDPRVAGIAADWHNAYARLLLDIADEVGRLPDDRSRLELLGRLRRTLRA